GLLGHAALEEAGRQARSRRACLLHDEPRRACAPVSGAQGDTRAGRRSLDRLAEEGFQARHRPHVRVGAGGRARGRSRRQQELRDRRRLAGAALRLPSRGSPRLARSTTQRLLRSGCSPAASIAATASASSSSPGSPLTPTAPTLRSPSWTATPPLKKL